MKDIEDDQLPLTQNPSFPRKLNLKKAAVVTSVPKTETDFYSTEKLNEMSKTDWENTFTLPKLRKKWKTKMILNFDPNFKRINDNYISPKALECREYVRNFVDPDILQYKKREWNNSVDVKEKVVDKQRDIFESSVGLKYYNEIKLKENKIPEGTETRDKMFIDYNRWNNSFYIDKKHNLKEYQNSKILDKKNTYNYWRKTEYDRENENQIPISPSRLLYESPRYYKKYRTPKEDAKYTYNIMKKVKNLTWLEREKAFEKIMHDNPGNEKNLEKINSLTDKYMNNLYKQKYNEIIGKNIINKKNESYIKHWKDIELIYKMNTISNWKNIKWFKPVKLTSTNYNFYKKNNFNEDVTEYSEKFNNTENNEDYRKREILKPLVALGTEIAKEEKKIKYNMIDNYKKQLKLESIKNNSLNNSIKKNKEKTNFISVTDFESKYPINKKKYLLYKNNNKNLENNNQNLPLLNNNDYGKYLKSENYKDSINQKIFLEAYKNVTIKDIKKEKNKNINNSIEYVYKHPGAYRQFEFNPKNNLLNDPTIFKSKPEKFEAWSCCMNTNKNSQGCQKMKINKMKWNYI